MRSSCLCFAVASAMMVALLPAESADAALTFQQKKELSKIRRDLSKVSSLIRRRKYDEAKKLIDSVEQRFNKVVKQAKLPARSRIVVGTKRSIQVKRIQLGRAQGKPVTQAAGIDFIKQIAPILRQRCGRCHTKDARGGLRIDQTASLSRVIVSGNARSSKLIQRLVAAGKQRMPQGGRPLSVVEIKTLALWINQGAKFSANSVAGKIPAKKTAAPKVKIAKATGKETVSFRKEIAPFMVNLCIRCHNDRRKRGGLSLATFEKMMQGGKSGRVILPGNIDGSRMWDLVGKQKPIKMPQGQARITRTNWRNLRTWIEEGAKYDGGDPRKTLRSLVPTDEELKAAKLAKFSPVEFAQYRQKRTEDAWNRVLPKEKPRSVESSEFFVYGNVSVTRLEEIDKWAEAHAAQLRKLFKDSSKRLFKGKLAIVVMKDRFAYEEFNLVIHRREIPREMRGHSVVDSVFEDAYVVLQDGQNDNNSKEPGMKVNLIDHLTGAFMKRSGGKLPDWVLRGTGLAMAAKDDSRSPYISGLRDKVPAILRKVQSPEAIFANGTFSPTDVGAVGYTLVEFMIRVGGDSRFGKFIATLQRGSNVAAALKAVYQADAKSMAQAYARGFAKKRRR